MQTWSVAIDRERCIGSGMCLVYASGTFAHDDEAIAVLLEPVTDDIDTVRVAVEACPTQALQLMNDEEGA